MNRREFMALVSRAAVVWPLAGRAQQPTMPVVGLLDQRAPDELADRLRVLSDLEQGSYFSAPEKSTPA